MTAISFIGSGNMASALIGGLIQAGYNPEEIRACDPNQDSLNALLKSYPSIKTYTNNSEGLAGADIVVFAVKPQILKQVIAPIAATLQNSNALLISIAAGITEKSISQWLGNNNLAMVRCMPNTPALVGQGASGLFANKAVTESQKQQAQDILAAVGSVVWVETENQLDAVTALSGSGPAYFFLVMEAMQAAGEALGLSSELAQSLTLQTALGAATMASRSDVDTAELRRRVTSPNGTTEAAIKSLENSQIREVFLTALSAAHHRSEELAIELGE